MKIVRDGKEIVLTVAELEEAYREREHQYRLADADRQVEIWCEYNDDPVMRRVLHLHAALERIVDLFEDNYDYSVGESKLWQMAIFNYVEEYML